jgi:hypothetical protein
VRTTHNRFGSQPQTAARREWQPSEAARQTVAQHSDPASAAQLSRLAVASPTGAARAAKQMQRRYGNAAIERMANQARPAAPTVQAKLVVTAPGDRYEQEADRAAQAAQLSLAEPDSVQRAGLSPVRPSAGVPVTPAVEAGIHAARSGGQPLPESVRSQVEGALGADFAGVRVHTGSRAHALNEWLQARAFTTGRHIFFRQGEYAPGSAGGRALLAHELAHVMQQGEAKIQYLQSLTIKPRVGEVAEQAADHRREIQPFKQIRVICPTASPGRVIQRQLFPVKCGAFEYDMRPVEYDDDFHGSRMFGMIGAIEFQPGVNCPDSESIGLIQIVHNKRSIESEERVGLLKAHRSHIGYEVDVADRTKGREGLLYASGSSLLSGNKIKLTSDVYHNPHAPEFSRQGVIIRGKHGYKRGSDRTPAVLYDTPGTAQPPNKWKFRTIARDLEHNRDLATLNWGFTVTEKKEVRPSTVSATDQIYAEYKVAVARQEHMLKIVTLVETFIDNGRVDISSWYEGDMFLKELMSKAQKQSFGREKYKQIVTAIKRIDDELLNNRSKYWKENFFKALAKLREDWRTIELVLPKVGRGVKIENIERAGKTTNY